MKYITALSLIDICVANKVLVEKNGKIYVYRNSSPNHKAGWFLDEKDIVAMELMNSEEGQKLLIDKLKEKGVAFSEENFDSLISNLKKLKGDLI